MDKDSVLDYIFNNDPLGLLNVKAKTSNVKSSDQRLSESFAEINDFYKEMQRWSFNLQVYFLNSRFRQIIDIKKLNKKFIQDRTIYEDAYIFAPNLHAMGLMSTRDFDNYKELFSLMDSLVEGPDLLIYLRASVPTLVDQIQKRGREYENSIRLDYLTQLNKRYEEWIESYDKGNLLIIDVDDLNFSENGDDLGSIIEKIDAKMNGLFEETKE